MPVLRNLTTRVLWTVGLVATVATSAPDTRRTGTSDFRELSFDEVVHVTVRPSQKAEVANRYEVRAEFEKPLPAGFRLEVVPDDPSLGRLVLDAEDAEEGYFGLSDQDRELQAFVLPVPDSPCAGDGPCELGYSLEVRRAPSESDAEPLRLRVSADLDRDGEAGCLQMNPPGFDAGASVEVSFDD